MVTYSNFPPAIYLTSDVMHTHQINTSRLYVDKQMVFTPTLVLLTKYVVKLGVD